MVHTELIGVNIIGRWSKCCCGCFVFCCCWGFLFCFFAYGLIFTIFLQFTGALFIFKEVTTEVICNLQEE